VFLCIVLTACLVALVAALRAAYSTALTDCPRPDLDELVDLQVDEKPSVVAAISERFQVALVPQLFGVPSKRLGGVNESADFILSGHGFAFA